MLQTAAAAVLPNLSAPAQPLRLATLRLLHHLPTDTQQAPAAQDGADAQQTGEPVPCPLGCGVVAPGDLAGTGLGEPLQIGLIAYAVVCPSTCLPCPCCIGLHHRSPPVTIITWSAELSAVSGCASAQHHQQPLPTIEMLVVACVQGGNTHSRTSFRSGGLLRGSRVHWRMVALLLPPLPACRQPLSMIRSPLTC